MIEFFVLPLNRVFQINALHAALPVWKSNLLCRKCARGTYSMAVGSKKCSLCARGQFQPDSAASVCLDCAVGKHQSVSGQISCVGCSEGTYNPTTGVVPNCTLCPEGIFQSMIGSSSCTQCGRGEFANQGAVICRPKSTALRTPEMKASGSADKPTTSQAAALAASSKSAQLNEAPQQRPTDAQLLAPGILAATPALPASRSNATQTLVALPTPLGSPSDGAAEAERRTPQVTASVVETTTVKEETRTASVAATTTVSRLQGSDLRYPKTSTQHNGFNAR